MKVTRKALVNLPALSFKNKELLYLKFLTMLATSQHVGEEDDGREPATTARVINIETGEVCEFIAPTLLVSALSRYGAYVGKCFEIHCTKDKMPGKNYRGVTCYEIEEPEGIKDIDQSGIAPQDKAPAPPQTGKAVDGQPVGVKKS